MENQNQEKAPEHWTVYASGSVLLSLIGLVGILSGYFMDAHVGNIIAGGEPVLRGALVGVIIEIVRGSISLPVVWAGTGLQGYLPQALYFTVLLLVAALILSLCLTIACVILPRRSRRLYALNAKLLFLPYGLLFFGNLLYCALTQGELDKRFFDAPTALTAATILAVTFLTALAENPKKSGANLLLLALSLITVCALSVPSPLVREMNALVNSDYPKTAESAALSLLLAVSACNLALSVIRLGAKRGYFFDLLRFGLQLGCVLALIALFPGPDESILDFFSNQPLAAILLLVGALGGVVFSAFFLASFAKKRKRDDELYGDSPVFDAEQTEQTEATPQI